MHNYCKVVERDDYGAHFESRIVQEFRLAGKIDLNPEGSNVIALKLEGELPEEFFRIINQSPDIYEFRDDYLLVRNMGRGGKHSEVAANDVLLMRGEYGYDIRSQVTYMYSELQMCRKCIHVINPENGYRNLVLMEYSFRYPREAQLKQMAVNLLETNGKPMSMTWDDVVQAWYAANPDKTTKWKR